jgi:hypothetical protein
VDSTTGIESGTPQLGLNVQFSQQTLNLRLNASATKTALLITAENERVFSQEVFYDAIPDQFQYGIPADMCEIRGLWWRDPTLSGQDFDPGDYNLMSYQDEIQNPDDFGGQVGRPSWRIVGNTIVLNQNPGNFSKNVNEQGIWLRYVRTNTYLTEDSDVLDFPYARFSQECVVWDTTLSCIRTQDEVVDTSGIEKELAYWNQQLEILVRNEYKPPTMIMKGPGLVKNTFAGR